MAKQTAKEQARTAFIVKTVTQYRHDAAQQGIKEITEEEWAAMMRARMDAQYKKQSS